jgi:hypothetical protein
MSAIHIVLLVLALAGGYLWIASLACNISSLKRAFFPGRAGSSPIPVVGSVGGVLALLMQPFQLPVNKVAWWTLALLPDAVWIISACAVIVTLGIKQGAPRHDKP